MPIRAKREDPYTILSGIGVIGLTNKLTIIPNQLHREPKL